MAGEDTQVVGDDEDIIVEIDDEPEEGSSPVVEKEPQDKEDDEDDEDDGVPDEDDEGSATEDKRRSRAAERRRKREKARFERESLQREVASLRNQNAESQRRLENLDKRTVSQDLSQIDAAIGQASHASQQAEREIAEAVAAGNGVVVVEAQRKWYQAAKAIEQLVEIKKRAQQQPSPQQGVDPVLRANFDAWHARTPWYDVTRKDPDSSVTFAVDNSLAAEGWNPRDPGYWDELDTRLKRYLPHRYQQKSQDTDDRQRAKPPTGGTSKNSTLKPNQVRLSPERVAAIKEAGAWDDTEQRKKYIKRYADYDKAHRGEK